ncbi:MAG: pyridoxal 5'-phosphate synthase glutaminase subunit PdxT [Chlamydiales bacterium]|nr:pyridoxal 5'-phosphate synthase glutaminase subunit PdxT [Chlamydiales bacterium]
MGVLALQGAFSKHCEMLARLGVPSLEVRTPDQLAIVDGLIIPGGESTTMWRLNDLPLKEFNRPIFGTCAGMILMARLGLLDVTVERNAYGRQCASFSTELTLYLDKLHTMRAIFIRAPRVTEIHSPDVRLLADTPVLIRQGDYLASSFHPELTNDPAIHHYFIQICKEKQSLRRQSKITPTRSFQTI